MKRNEDFFEIIGKITMFFSTVDLLATTLILKFKALETESLELPKETATLGIKINYLEKIKLINPQSKIALSYIHDNLSFIYTVVNERNRYMHDQWLFNPETIKLGHIDRIKLTSSGLKETTSLYHDDLTKFCFKVGKVQKIFMNAMKKSGIEISALGQIDLKSIQPPISENPTY